MFLPLSDWLSTMCSCCEYILSNLSFSCSRFLSLSLFQFLPVLCCVNAPDHLRLSPLKPQFWDSPAHVAGVLRSIQIRLRSRRSDQRDMNNCFRESLLVRKDARRPVVALTTRNSISQLSRRRLGRLRRLRRKPKENAALLVSKAFIVFFERHLNCLT